MSRYSSRVAVTTAGGRYTEIPPAETMTIYIVSKK